MINEPISAEENLDKNERQSASWDLRNSIRNYSTLVITQFAVAFFSFASVTLCTRKLGAEGYGGIVAVIAASSVAQIFVNWTCVALARYGVEEFIESGKISKSFWSRTLIFLPNTLIFFAFSLLWFPLLAHWLKLPNEAFWLVSLHFFAMATWLHVQHALQGAKLPRLQGIFLAIERLLIFTILLLLVFTGHLTWLTAVWAYILPPFLMSVSGLWKLRKLVSWKFEVDSPTLKKILKFSVPLIPFSLIGYFSTSYLDAIFISQYLSKSDLGIYSIAYQINGILMQFPVLAGSLLMPLFVTLQANNQEGKIKTYLTDVLPLLTLGGGLICITLAILFTFLSPIIFGAEIAKSSLILWVLVASSAIALPSLIAYIPYMNKNSATYIGTPMAIMAAVTNFFANWILIPKYGLVGCAWATVLSNSASLLVVVSIVHWKYPLNHRWTLQALLPTIFACAIFSWSNSLLNAVGVFFVASIILIAIYRRSFQDGLRFLLNYRNFIANS